MKKTLKDIVDIAICAAIYVAFTLVLYPLSYGSPQFRLSECLVLLTFYKKKYGIGIIFGVLIANFFNPEFALIDMIFGTLSTAIAVLLISFTKRLFIATLWPTLTSFIVALEITIMLDIPLWLSSLEVVGSMFIIESVIGYSIFKLIGKNKGFIKLINPDIKEEKNEIRSERIENNVSQEQQDWRRDIF